MGDFRREKGNLGGTKGTLRKGKRGENEAFARV